MGVALQGTAGPLGPQVFANEAQYVQHQLLLVREQLKLLQERKKFLLPKPAAVPIVVCDCQSLGLFESD